jgi:NAD(P)-dependent dehydrogenase (short-subunit alcohol dehydrogenase family)
VTRNGDGRLAGRVALITGAGQGIGRAIALAYAREGADVAVGELDPVKAKSTAEAVRALGRQSAAIVGDVGVREDCERMVAETVRELGGLDVLVNGAAWAQPNTPIHETSDELYQRTFDVCMTSVFWTSRAAYPHLKKSGRGCVINFASNAGTEGMAGNAVYAATKEAIRGFSRSLAREWGRDGIRVNMIRPIAASPSLAGWIEQNPKLAATQARAIPLGRFGDCDADIAPVAVFLASDESRFLTAVTLPADGGGGQER